MNARDITRKLHGKWHGGYGVAPCPVCQFEARKDQTALTFRDGDNDRLLLNCKKQDCSFADILYGAGIGLGDYQPPSASDLAQRKAKEDRETRRRSDQAERRWNEAGKIEGTLAETYLTLPCSQESGHWSRPQRVS